MKTMTATCLALLIAPVWGAGAPVPKEAAAVNLVVNGSFEEGPEVMVYAPLDKGSEAIKGWVVTRGQIDVVEHTKDQWKAAHGKRLLDLHGSPGFGGVEQSIATKPGRKYRVTFKMSGNPGVAHEKVQLSVRAAGQDKEFEVDLDGRSYEDLKWEAKTWAFTAKEKATVLELHTAMPATANGFGGPLLDDVKVVELD